MSRITVIGSLNMDLVISSPKIPILGETVLGKDFITIPGGKGANQAVAAARLGGKVCMAGCIGNDPFGRELLKNLSVNNVNIENIKIKDEYPTGIAFVVIVDGNNYIIVDPGANYSLVPEDIDDMSDVIKNSDMILLQLEIPLPVVERVVDTANSYGVKILLNPAPARQLDDHMLEKIDIFTPNESECGTITGQRIRNIQDAKDAVVYLNKKGISNVIVTLGDKGAVYNDGTKIIHRPAVDIQAVDTTAAGDAFSGAFAVAYAQGRAMDEAVNFANIAAALSVSKKGAQSSLPDLGNVSEFGALFCNDARIFTDPVEK